MNVRWFSCFMPIAALVPNSILTLTLLLSLCRLAHGQTLQLHYTFENGSGTVVTDVSGHARNGTLTGAQFTTDHKQGQYAAQTFASQKGHIAIAPFDLTNQFSLFMFVKLPNVVNGTNSLQPIFANVQGGLTNGIKIYVSHFATDDRSIGMEVNNGSGQENSTLFSPTGVYPADGAYHSIAAVIDRTTGSAVLYLDGARVATGGPGTLRTDFNTNTGAQWLGDFPNGGFEANETIDDFRIYSGLLSDTQVKSLNAQTQNELMLQNVNTRQLAFWNLNGQTVTGGFLLPLTPSAGWAAVGMGDFDGDGQADILFQNATSGQLAIWYRNGSTISKGDLISTLPASGYKVAGVADFNRDGVPDILFQKAATGQIAVWYMHGSTFIGGAVTALVPSTGFQVVGTADFNGDGNPDIVFQNQQTGQVACWYMNNMTVNGGGLVPWTPLSGWLIKAVGDYNSDGSPDLLFQNQTTGQIVVWYLSNTQFLGGGALSDTPLAGYKLVGPR